MKSKWKTTYNPSMGNMPYSVYRQIDTTGVDHAGNREYYRTWFATREVAQVAADILNNGKVDGKKEAASGN